MAFYTLFMVFGPEKNFELISGRFGEKLNFGPFCPFFRPQKVFLLPDFLLLTKRPWASGDLKRALCWSKEYFFPACLLLTVLRSFVCKAHFGSQKRATVPRCTETHWTTQTSKYTWILIISWKTGVLGVNKANFSKIRKILIFDPPKNAFFTI